MNNQREVLTLRLANGALIEAPVYEQTTRGTNYLAIIDVDPTMPGGLARRFAQRGRGECLYLTEKLDLFDAVEFAADCTKVGGTKYRVRWYGVLIAKTEDYLLVEKCQTGVAAVLRAKQARTSPLDRKRALEAERDTIISRAATIEQEIVQIESEQVAKGVLYSEEQLLAFRNAFDVVLSLLSQPVHGAMKHLREMAEGQLAEGDYRSAIVSLIDLGKRGRPSTDFWLALGDVRALVFGEDPEQANLRTTLRRLLTEADTGSRGRVQKFHKLAASNYAEGIFGQTLSMLRLISIARKQSDPWLEDLHKLGDPTTLVNVLRSDA